MAVAAAGIREPPSIPEMLATPWTDIGGNLKETSHMHRLHDDSDRNSQQHGKYTTGLTTDHHTASRGHGKEHQYDKEVSPIETQTTLAALKILLGCRGWLCPENSPPKP
ncbi:MAG: hypothetical protein AAF589_00780 [Planctomycetota bacterium]